MTASVNGQGRDSWGRPDASRQRPGTTEAVSEGLYAALDLGTNNCRLLVAKPSQDGFRVVDAFSRIVRLGEGLAASGRLSGPAMSRTLEALKICAAKIRRRGVTRVRAVATEACRRADNCEDFLERVRRETGIELEIISQNEEAALAICGCAPLIDPDIPDILLFDIGGGSTEICWLKAEPAPGGPAEGAPLAAAELSLFAWASVPIGVITLAERHGGGEISPDTYQAMATEMAAAVAVFDARHKVTASVAGGKLQMLGTSGTVTTLAGVHKNLPRYDRSRVDGSYLDMPTVHDICARITAMTYDQRAAHPCIGPERADLVVAGCAILSALCRLWPAERLRVADRGLREGMLYAMIHGISAPEGRWADLGAAPGLD
ncbi:Ppx/GppA phosphatase family protein [Pelagibius marinus]|uniref:Ppx/GppA phosphatase family protein n=1 Tax=Pelagibius marinus TaxID=2762760 RepID=UPI0018726FFA|nr:Ppx/GppA phosphatase family protein [Pelagibius marinus]